MERLRSGADEWNAWRKANPDIKIDLSGADLRDMNLTGANFSRANLANAKFVAVTLSRARFSDAILTNACLSGANLSETEIAWADLANAKLMEANFTNASLMGTNFTGANISYADFTNADVRESNFTNATLSWANFANANLSNANLTNAKLIVANFSDADVSQVQWDRSQMRGKYIGIRGLGSCFGEARFKRDAADQDFLDTLEREWSVSWRYYLFRCWGLIDYGRSLWRILALAVGVIVTFGAIFSVWPPLLGYKSWEGDSTSPTDRFTPFFFSIVTFTTVGFGGVSPKGNMLGEIIVSTEVILGYVTFGLLISVLGNKVARRS
jgi:uncharacterized protein YjbI with pentapeptide repeats